MHYLFKESRTKTTLSLGRLRPLMLAGKGCWLAAKQRHLVCAKDEKEYENYLVTEAAKQRHNQYMAQVGTQQEVLLDTVGAICMDMQGNLYAGVSSGGLALKQVGRIGEAAILGAGCWANHQFTCSISGTGESIMLSMLAKTCADLSESSDEMDSETMLKQLFSKLVPCANDTPSYAGLIVYRKDWKELLWCYNTASFAVAYQTNTMKDTVAFVSKNTNKPFALGAVKV